MAIVAIVGGLIYDGIRQYIYKIYDVGLDEVNVRCEVNDDRRILVFEPKDDEWGGEVVRNWIRNRKTLEFLATWEEIYNPNFKVFESEHFKKQAGLLTFTPSVSEWVEQTKAIGIFVKKGRRFLTKNNYLIQTDAIKNYIVPNCNSKDNLQWLPYAEEADLLNVG